jgi:hypothetical protein
MATEKAETKLNEPLKIFETEVKEFLNFVTSLKNNL